MTIETLSALSPVLSAVASQAGAEGAWPWWAGGMLFHLCAVAMVVLHVLQRRRDAASAVLWIFLAWSFPLGGALLYLAFGVDRVSPKVFLKKTVDARLLTERQSRESEALPLAYWRTVHEAMRGEPDTAFGRELDRAMQALIPEHPLMGGNEVQPLVTGDETYPVLFEAIAAARHHVHLQSFIIGHDAVGRRMMDLLAQKAAEGVEVRLLFDRFGSTHAFLRGMFRRYRGLPHFQIAGWTQANPLKAQFQINLRNHRKITIIDGLRAFSGGINLAIENTTRGNAPALRDYHFDLRGPVTQELQFTFMRDWYFITNEDPDLLFSSAYYPHVPSAGNSLIRVINSGPASRHNALADAFFLAVADARKQVLAVTPYFTPPQMLLQAFRAAALRGVDVRLIVPRKNNHFYAGLASQAYYEELMDAGVRIFEREPPFMHAKALLVDNALAIVGTANLDERSLRLNYETCMAIHDPQFVDRMKPIVLEDEAASEEVSPTAWRRRPTRRRMLENFAALMSPVL